MTDGARYLRAVVGADPRLCSIVAFHTSSSWEAPELGLDHALNVFWPAEPELVDAITITYCDLTSSPAGDLADPADGSPRCWSGTVPSTSFSGQYQRPGPTHGQGGPGTAAACQGGGGEAQLIRGTVALRNLSSRRRRVVREMSRESSLLWGPTTLRRTLNSP
jgi:hypothetical protein